MATGEQIKSLIRSHFDEESERFYTIALQVAAHEARQGHAALAHDIRLIVDKARQERKAKVIRFPQDLQSLVIEEEPRVPFSALVLPDKLLGRIERIIHEYRQRNKLKSHGLWHRRRILLIGPPGTGKTMSAKVLAHELRLPLSTVQVDRLVTKFMGETSAKLRQIFDLIQQQIGVYLFDEFDALGGERSMENDVGEMRRVLNTFLQLVDQDLSDSLIVAATNSPKLLDRALFRRFDDVLFYANPDADHRKRLALNILGSFVASEFAWSEIITKSDGLSHSEIDQACRDAMKLAILDDAEAVNEDLLRQTLQERREAHQRV